MEIILKEDIKNLGYKNDLIEVKPGFGRNYLIPAKKAILATTIAKKAREEMLKQRAFKEEKIKKRSRNFC
jgi:large subunit ribosomal protein L9